MLKPDGTFKTESIDMIMRTIFDRALPLYLEQPELDAEGNPIEIPTGNFKGTKVFVTTVGEGDTAQKQGVALPFLVMPEKSMGAGFIYGLGLWASVPGKFPPADFPPVAAAPVAQDQAVAAVAAEATTITLVAVDPNGLPLTYTLVAQPTNGSVSIADNVVTYTGTAEGTDSFTFTASNGVWKSNVATVSITVAAAAAG